MKYALVFTAAGFAAATPTFGGDSSSASGIISGLTGAAAGYGSQLGQAGSWDPLGLTGGAKDGSGSGRAQGSWGASGEASGDAGGAGGHGQGGWGGDSGGHGQGALGSDSGGHGQGGWGGDSGDQNGKGGKDGGGKGKETDCLSASKATDGVSVPLPTEPAPAVIKSLSTSCSESAIPPAVQTAASSSWAWSSGADYWSSAVSSLPTTQATSWVPQSSVVVATPPAADVPPTTLTSAVVVTPTPVYSYTAPQPFSKTSSAGPLQVTTNAAPGNQWSYGAGLLALLAVVAH